MHYMTYSDLYDMAELLDWLWEYATNYEAYLAEEKKIYSKQKKTKKVDEEIIDQEEETDFGGTKKVKKFK